ncbi:hypothetical protein F1880_000816 [Penicillium rolfsii]|nr:hypothetical protein F1880_000816 [Penicillium rolfsii]
MIVQTDDFRRGCVGGYFIADTGTWRSSSRLQSKDNRYGIAEEDRKQSNRQLPMRSQIIAPRPRHYG